nr:hypothetical protein [uncultured Butyrivibrio sp.]
MAVYRMKFAPDVMIPKYAKGTELYDLCRDEIFERFKEHNFIGTGWEDVPLKSGMTDEEIRTAANLPKGSIESLKNICNIRKDDLIWVIRNGSYYLFKVDDNKVGTSWLQDTFEKDKEWFSKRDIAHCYTGKWLEIGKEVNVPGIVINNMGVGSTLREIKKGVQLSEMIWNRFSNSDYYETKNIDENGFWNLLTDRQVEGIVLAYIQVKYDCIVNTESLKHNTAVYECELITKNGIHYYPQVKTGSSGNKDFPVMDYCKTIKNLAECTGHASVPVLFYENEDYGDYSDSSLIKIYRKDLMNFISENRNVVSDSILEAYALLKADRKIRL